MSLIDFPINLDRVAAALERIADCLERAYPAPTPEELRPIEVAQLSDLKVIDSEADQRKSDENAELAMRWGVVPNSPAFEEALAAYEKEHDRFYTSKGEEPPKINWEEAFLTAAGQRQPDKAEPRER